jgi:hypothetical protein
MAATLFVAGVAHGKPACPAYVTSPSGSVFNVAALVADNGSPEAGLARVRAARAKIEAGGGCRIFRDVPACEETVELAKRTEAALEQCATPVSHNAPPRPGDPERPDAEIRAAIDSR